MDSVTIRPITLDDAEGFNACVGVIAEERRWILVTRRPELEGTRAFLEKGLAAGVPHVVAVDRDRIVGWCDVRPSSFEGFTHSGTLGMGLLPSHRARGLGRRLLDATMDRAWATGLTRVELTVYASNERAIRLYERAGFVHEGMRRRARFLDGAWDDLVMMAIVRE